MLQKIKNLIMVAVVPLALGAPLVLAPAASAACSGVQQNIAQGANDALSTGDGCSVKKPGDQTLSSVAGKVVNTLSIIVGIVAVIMIIVGGFRYIASGGSNDKVAGAKNTLIYAVVGLIIVALAQFIVHFVLTNVSGA